MKSWKREVAGLTFLIWAAVSVRLFWFTSDPAMVSALTATYAAFSTPAWMYIGGAFIGHAWLNRGSK